MFSQPWFFVTTRLCTACNGGDLETLKKIGTPANINTTGWLGWSPLHNAASGGHSALVEYMTSTALNAQVDIRDLENHTPLMLACGTPTVTAGHIETVRILIDKGANVDASDDGGFAPLHLAASNNNVEIAKLLIEAGCSIDQTNQYAWTPLHIACQGGAANKELISLLLQSGASKDVTDARGKTPADLARKAGLKLEFKAAKTETMADTDEVLMSQLEKELSNQQPTPMS